MESGIQGQGQDAVRPQLKPHIEKEAIYVA
jgi:hypothetical protein